MKTGSRPNLERENPVICEKSGGDAVKLKTFLITASLWMGLVGLTACGGADVRTYQYPETALLFDSLHIKKTVYSPGVMELYYRGGQFKDNPIRCYDANFEDLGDQFDHTFRNGVLTVQADFAEQISGLTIEDKDHDTVYHLRYLDSPQFAWLADTFWLDYGMMTMGDEARYYSDAERQAQAERERAEHAQTRNVFALLEGTWISEDGLQKYVFSTDADGSELRAAARPELCSARAGVRPHGARHRQGGGQALGAHQVHRGAARGKSGICLGSRADKAGPDGHAPAGAGLVSGALSGQLWKKSRSIGIIFTALLRLPAGKLAGSLFESPYIVILQNIPL